MELRRGITRMGYTPVWIVDGDGIIAHTEAPCAVPDCHAWFLDWLERQDPEAAPVTQERVRAWLEEWVRGEIRESDASPDDTNLCYDYARLRLAAFLAEKIGGK